MLGSSSGHLMLYAQTDPDPGVSPYKYPCFSPPPSHFSSFAEMTHTYYDPSSPASTIEHCAICRSPVDLSEELARLSVAVAELLDYVAEIHALLVGAGSIDVVE